MRAGLIPSRALQERRIVQERNEINGVENDKEGILKSFVFSSSHSVSFCTFSCFLNSFKNEFLF